MDLRLKWLFRPALSPAQMDEREASCPSELFTSDPFKWDDADPKVQVRLSWPYRGFMTRVPACDAGLKSCTACNCASPLLDCADVTFRLARMQWTTLMIAVPRLNGLSMRRSDEGASA